MARKFEDIVVVNMFDEDSKSINEKVNQAISKIALNPSLLKEQDNPIKEIVSEMAKMNLMEEDSKAFVNSVADHIHSTNKKIKKEDIVNAINDGVQYQKEVAQIEIPKNFEKQIEQQLELLTPEKNLDNGQSSSIANKIAKLVNNTAKSPQEKDALVNFASEKISEKRGNIHLGLEDVENNKAVLNQKIEDIEDSKRFNQQNLKEKYGTVVTLTKPDQKNKVAIPKSLKNAAKAIGKTANNVDTVLEKSDTYKNVKKFVQKKWEGITR